MIAIKKMLPRNVLELASVVVIVAFSLAGGLAVYWLHFDDNPPMIVNNEPLPVVGPETYAPGDEILFEFDFCRYSDGGVTRTRRWIDGLMYTEPPLPIAGGRENECRKTHLMATVPQLPPGRYFVEYNVSYDINPLSPPRLVVFRTAYFTVTEAP